MFQDKRSRRIVFVAHCILNQNAKVDRCAHHPGAVTALVALLADSGAGIVQMPCPELLYLGLDRRADPAIAATVEAEDTRIAQLMADEAGTAFCRALAASPVYQAEEYTRHGFEVIGLIGINGSPTCGVETTWADGQEQQGPGVFVRALQALLNERGLALPARGLKVYQPEAARAAVDLLLRAE